MSHSPSGFSHQGSSSAALSADKWSQQGHGRLEGELMAMIMDNILGINKSNGNVFFRDHRLEVQKPNPSNPFVIHTDPLNEQSKSLAFEVTKEVSFLFNSILSVFRFLAC